MNCDDARLLLLDAERARLSPELERELAAHLEACPACARARAAEQVLTELLERRLPVYGAPVALRRRLSALAMEAIPPPPAEVLTRPRTWARKIAPALALAAAALVATTAVLVDRTVMRGDRAGATLTSEAVNDHLRVLQREPRVELESSASHQVKPWFEGKLDFAPSVPAPVAPEMRLIGGSVGYFVDRKAAVVVYGLRRHVLTLLVFRADGLPWPPQAAGRERTPSGHALRGFHVFLWRSGGLGYALVSDSDPVELSGIAATLAART